MTSDREQMDPLGSTAKDDDIAAAANGKLPLWKDQRRHRRVHLDIALRFLTADGLERDGRVLDISAGGVAVLTELRPEIGSNVIIYIDSLGRFSGPVRRHLDCGFAIEANGSPNRREKTADQLTWQVNKRRYGFTEDREYTRGAPQQNAKLRRADGTEVSCRVLELSLGGLSIEIAERPAIGEIIAIGRMEGRVVRHFGNGVGVEFTNVPQLRRGLNNSIFES